MYTLFVSDLHLNAERPEKLELFAQFIDALDQRCDGIYLLGDIFEFWHGDDDYSEDHTLIIDGLTTITNKQIPLYIQKGNRDFLIGKSFTRNTGSRLLSDPACIDLYGQKYLIMHGDLLCTDDLAYQRFRRFVNNRWYQRLFLLLPLSIRRKISARVRHASVEETQSKSEAIMDVNENTVNEYLLRHDVYSIIHGHTHRPAHHQWTLHDKTANRYVLGDWYEDESILYASSAGKELMSVATFIKTVAKLADPAANSNQG